MQPTFVLQDLMHSRLAGCRGDGVEGELKQRAGEGPLRSDGDDATPARHIGRTQSRPNGSVRKQQLKKHISGITANSKSKPAIPHVDARFRKHQFQTQVVSQHISKLKERPRTVLDRAERKKWMGNKI